VSVSVSILSRGHKLAESPRFNKFSGELNWVDIETSHLYFYAPSTGLAQKYFDTGITSVNPVSRNTYIFTSHNGVHQLERGKVRHLWLSSEPDGWRFNDSFFDGSSQLIVGTKSFEHDSPAKIGAYSSGKLSWHPERLSLANGIARDYARGVMYISDSLSRRILRWSPPSRHQLINDSSSFDVFVGDLEGEPDGLAIDKSGNIWAALWGAGKISKFNVAGEHVHSWDLAASNISSIAWADKDQTFLLVTTSMSGHDTTKSIPIRSGEVALMEFTKVR